MFYDDDNCPAVCNPLTCPAAPLAHRCAKALIHDGGHKFECDAITHRVCSDCGKPVEVRRLERKQDGRLLCPECRSNAYTQKDKSLALESAGQLRLGER